MEEDTTISHGNRVLIFVVAYNAGKTIVDVVNRIPTEISRDNEISLLIIDDCSQDATANIARKHLSQGYWCDFEVLRNPVNQGYGGNQKIGYLYAAEREFDVVVLLHGDGQYAPELLPELLSPFSEETPPDAVFGSRMINRKDALRGGMPLYKFVGNQILTKVQNWLLNTSLSEFHTGYRIYSVAALRKLPIELNTNDFHFDTEIIVQLVFSDATVKELPITTFYGDEVCHVDGMQYALDVIKASIKARLITMGIFYDPKFATQGESTSRYVDKLDFSSTHSIAFEEIKDGTKVLDLGCADGHLSATLSEKKQCDVISCDTAEKKDIKGCLYLQCDLNKELPNVAWQELDYIVLLDVIEHLEEPELFLERLRTTLSGNEKVKVIVSSGNVCFWVTRMMMLLGQFNYGSRGILDITHKRLFTVKSLKRALSYSAYNVDTSRYVPAPYPLAIGLNPLSRFMLAMNKLFATIAPGLFSYQALFVASVKPATSWLLNQAENAELDLPQTEPAEQLTTENAVDA
jgi:glycosyltransferase involved in cell wall biosynthesis